MLKEAENRLDIHVKTARPEPADEEAPASESESEDEFEQQLARARHAGTTAAARKKAKAKAKQDQQAGTTTAKKPISKLDRFQQKKIGYEMSISALQRTLAVQVKKAFELFEFISEKMPPSAGARLSSASVTTTTGWMKMESSRIPSVGSRG